MNNLKQRVRRKYIITFTFGGKYSCKYVRVFAQNKDEAFGNACAEYGFLNVSGVYCDNEYTQDWLRVHKFEELAVG